MLPLKLEFKPQSGCVEATSLVLRRNGYDVVVGRHLIVDVPLEKGRRLRFRGSTIDIKPLAYSVAFVGTSSDNGRVIR
jgi:hypothetical protein